MRIKDIIKSRKSDLSVKKIRRFLGEKADKYNIIIKDELDSTSSEIRRLAENGAKSGTVVIAEHQTNGRGRQGKSFYSPKGNGIYMSLLLHNNFSAENTALITTAVAVAVCRAIERITKKSVSIKWVNDLFLNNKKVCGILTEAVNNFEYIIIGIGINCRKTDMPDDLKEIAGSLEIDDNISRSEIVSAILEELDGLDTLIKGGDFLEEYRKKSMVIGKKIKILGRTEEYAKAIDIDESGGLVTETEDGERRTLLSGEISIRLNE